VSVAAAGLWELLVQSTVLVLGSVVAAAVVQITTDDAVMSQTIKTPTAIQRRVTR